MQEKLKILVKKTVSANKRMSREIKLNSEINLQSISPQIFRLFHTRDRQTARHQPD